MKKLLTRISAIALALTLTASTSSGMTDLITNNDKPYDTLLSADAGSNIPSSVTIRGDNISHVWPRNYEPILKNNQGYELWFKTNGSLYIRNANTKSRDYNKKTYLVNTASFRKDISGRTLMVNYQGDGNFVCYAQAYACDWSKPVYHTGSYQPASKSSENGYKYTFLLLGDTLYVEQITPGGGINILFNSKRNSFQYCY